ncbi:MBG domain-containing protein, partial [Stenotrophomonas maltophilia]|uniref:MBG domain-containing protein n=1 Tax=Stenotrophomonas maltophilia TaxID=40324 RepID=UPI0013DC4E9F
YTGANLTVTPRAITVTAHDLSRVYGDANPALTFSVGGSGLVNGDVLSGGLATAAAASSHVGGYAIGQGTLGGANYT